MGSSILKDYLGRGLESALPDPAGFTIPASTAAFFYATDTEKLYALNGDGTAWAYINSGGGGGGTPANPTATAGPDAINGVASTYMRSDAAPAVQLATTGQFGLVKPDGDTITIVDGVITAVGGGGGGVGAVNVVSPLSATGTTTRTISINGLTDFGADKQIPMSDGSAWGYVDSTGLGNFVRAQDPALTGATFAPSDSSVVRIGAAFSGYNFTNSFPVNANNPWVYITQTDDGRPFLENTLCFIQAANTHTGNELRFFKNRGSLTAATGALDGDFIMRQTFYGGTDSNGFQASGSWHFWADGDHTNTSHGGLHRWTGTMPSSTTNLEWMRLMRENLYIGEFGVNVNLYTTTQHSVVAGGDVVTQAGNVKSNSTNSALISNGTNSSQLLWQRSNVSKWVLGTGNIGPSTGSTLALYSYEAASGAGAVVLDVDAPTGNLRVPGRVKLAGTALAGIYIFDAYVSAGSGFVGFFGATPVLRQDAPGNTLAEVLTALRNYGLISP